MEILVSIIGGLVVLWFAIGLLLRGPDLSQYDSPAGERGTSLDRVSRENEEARRLLRQMQKGVNSTSFRGRVAQMREVLDRGIPGAAMSADGLGVAIGDADAGGIPAEWVIAPNADASRRLLYLHGGAFAAGSPRSHRPITARLSKLAGVAVLAIDYRLMPENRRIAGILDCQSAYRWILDNGPEGPGAPGELFVAGDSAGGNLTLMLIAWIRDEGLRQVDAAVALSPPSDGTSSSPSMRNNVDTDLMLGPTFGKLANLPRTLILLFTVFAARMRPTNPLISPIFGDLSRLPPTLVQVSDSEMLADDGRRWVNKARGQGSDARLQTWPGMLHVWHAFADTLPEANEALEKIAAFVSEYAKG